MKTPKSTDRARRERQLLVTEMERLLAYSKRILIESRLEVRRIRRELGGAGR